MDYLLFIFNYISTYTSLYIHFKDIQVSSIGHSLNEYLDLKSRHKHIYKYLKYIYKDLRHVCPILHQLFTYNRLFFKILYSFIGISKD